MITIRPQEFHQAGAGIGEVYYDAANGFRKKIDW